MFFGATEITKANFFALFLVFSDRTFTSKLCISAFKKTGLIPFNPSVILDKIKEYKKVQDVLEVKSNDDKSKGFGISLPRL